MLDAQGVTVAVEDGNVARFELVPRDLSLPETKKEALLDLLLLACVEVDHLTVNLVQG